jgi:outer membrane protein assembly factor BamB
VDSQTGQELWKFFAGNGTSSSPTLVDGVLYVGNFQNKLLAVDCQTGQELWRFDAEGSVGGSPVVDEDVVYFLCMNGLYAVTIR